MIVAGIGCRRGAPAHEIQAAIQIALASAGIASEALNAIATAAVKQHEAGIVTAAAHFGVNVVFVPDTELKAAGTRAETKSERVRVLFGVPSVAEAAALAAAGPCSRLISKRQVVGAATCALAASEQAS